MTTKVGDLSVDVSANLAKLYDGLSQATNAVNKSAEAMKGAFDGVTRSIVSLAGSVVSVGAIFGGLRSALNFGDELQTANERLGISVQKLQELSGIAVQGSTSIEAIGKSFKFLGDSMIKAQTAGSEQARLFAALGVATKDAAGNLRSVDEVTQDVAGALDSIGNETTRTAAGVAIFGKSYLEVAAALRTYKDSQAAANEIIGQFGQVTATSTQAADTFGDKLALLGQGFKASTLLGLTPALEALNAAIAAITPTVALLAKAFGDLFGWLGTFAAANLINIVAGFKMVGTAIAAVAASITTLSTEPLKELAKDIKSIEVQRLVDLNKALLNAKFPGLGDQDQVSRMAAAADRLREVADRTKAVNDALKPLDQTFATAFNRIQGVLRTAQQTLDDFGKSITEQTSPSMKALLQVMASPEWAKFSAAQQQAIIDVGLTADAIDHETAALRKLAEEQKRYNDLEARAGEQYSATVARDTAALEGFTDGLRAQSAEYEFQIGLIGKTAVEQDKLIALHRIDIDLQRTLAALSKEATEEQRASAIAAADFAKQQISANIELRDNLELQQRGWADLLRNVTDGFATFFHDLLENGSSAFKNLWENFKRWALEAIAKIAAQQIVVSILGNITPVAGVASGAGGGLGGILGGGGGIPGLGSIGDILSGLAGGFGSLAGGAGSGILGSVGASFANLNLALTAGVDAIGGFGAALGAALPALGVVAGIGVAAYAVYQYLESKKGGPKEGGFAAIGVDRGTYFPGESTAGGDEAARKLVDSIQVSFETALQRLGGKAFDVGFALGFSTDPKGTALSNVHGGVFAGGRSIFENPNANVGRSPEDLQAELQHQAQQMLLAALQASDLPKYVAALLDSVDVMAASTEDITQILQMAEAIKAVADAFPDLQAQIENLDPEQVKAFIDALGGAEQLTASFAYLQKNFTTTAEQTKKNADALTSAFENLGLQAPQTHQAFMDLLASFDLTTEEGRNLYASVIALAPAFVAVAGSADDAARQLQDAAAFFEQNFYSDAERSAEAAADATRRLDEAQRSLGVSIPRTADGFRALVESLDQTTPAGKALYEALILLAPAVLEVSGAVADAVDDFAEAVAKVPEFDYVSELDKLTLMVEDQFRNLAEAAGGSLADQIPIQIGLVKSQIERYKALQQEALGRGDIQGAVLYMNAIAALENYNASLATQLARFTVLTAQYGEATASQLLDLEKWYADQKNVFYGNAAALAALDKIFKERWDAIIEGTGDGVDGAIDQLDRLRKAIADYLKSLTVSDLSPLTPAQKLAEAQAQYQEALAKAAAGDPTALADITKFADAYLRQARDFYASSPLYTQIFDQITKQLEELAAGPGKIPPEKTTNPIGPTGYETPPIINPDVFTGTEYPATPPLIPTIPEMPTGTGGTVPGGPLDLNSALFNSLPSTGNRLVSNDDLRKAMSSLEKVIADAMAAVADAGTEDAKEITAALRTHASQVVDGLGGNLK